eukprot:m.293737 g.293737  ORF g.293737 m.293737 type:complete len:282 (+) comp12856_c0_seq1:597-1442(+)
MPRSRDTALALSRFSQWHFAEPSCEDAAASLQQALFYYVHPALPFQAGKASVKELQLLREDWATAFESVFFLLVSGFCPYFYLHGPRRGFRVLFRVLCDGANDRHCVSVFNAPTALVSAMQGQGIDIPVTDRAHFVLDQSNSLGFVQCVIDFLSDQNRIHRSPPMIYAPVAFELAALKRIDMKMSEELAIAKSATTMQRTYRLIVTGPLMPHAIFSIFELVRLMNKTFDAQFTRDSNEQADSCEHQHQLSGNQGLSAGLRAHFEQAPSEFSCTKFSVAHER